MELLRLSDTSLDYSEAYRSDADYIIPLSLNTRRTRFKDICTKRLLAITIIILLSACLLVSIIFSIYYLHHQTTKPRSTNVCTSKDCFEISAKIYQKLDTDKSPCQDFEAFICGGYRKTNHATDSSTLKTALEDASGKLTNAIKEFLIYGPEDDYKNVENDRRILYENVQTLYRACKKFAIKSYTAFVTEGGKSFQDFDDFFAIKLDDVMSVINKYSMLKNGSSGLDFTRFMSVFLQEENLLSYIKDISSNNKSILYLDLLSAFSNPEAKVDFIWNIVNMHMTPSTTLRHSSFGHNSSSSNDTQSAFSRLYKQALQINKFTSYLEQTFPDIYNGTTSRSIFEKDGAANYKKLTPLKDVISYNKSDIVDFLIKIDITDTSLLNQDVEIMIVDAANISDFINYIMNSQDAFSYLAAASAVDVYKHLKRIGFIILQTPGEENDFCLNLVTASNFPVLYDIVTKYLVSWSNKDIEEIGIETRKSGFEVIKKIKWFQDSDEMMLKTISQRQRLVAGLDTTVNDAIMGHLMQNAVKLTCNTTRACLDEGQRLADNVRKATYASVTDLKSLRELILHSQREEKLFDILRKAGVGNVNKNVIQMLPGILQTEFYSKEYPLYVNFAVLGRLAARRFALYIEGILELRNINFRETMKCIKEDYTKEYAKVFQVEEDVAENSSTLEFLRRRFADLFALAVTDEAVKEMSLDEAELLPGYLSNYSQPQIYFMHSFQSMCSKWSSNYAKTFPPFHSEDQLTPFNINWLVKHSRYFTQVFKCDRRDKMYYLKNSCSVV